MVEGAKCNICARKCLPKRLQKDQLTNNKNQVKSPADIMRSLKEFPIHIF